MKNLYLFLLVVATLHSFAAKKKYAVAGTITQTADYCGGIAPSEAMLQMLRSPQPLEGKKIFVRKGNANYASKKIIAETASDADGNFKLHLRPGVYCIVFEDKLSPLNIPQNDNHTTWNKACMKTAHSKCEYTFTLKKEPLAAIKINYHKHCSFKAPCSNYQGPTPP
jgi:hypothetical protein